MVKAKLTRTGNLHPMARSHTFRIALLLLASVGDLPGDIHAAELGSAWSIDVPFEVTANSFFLSNGRTSNVFQSLSVESGVELSPYHRRWSAGAFVEHHIADAFEFDGMTITGIYATWRRGGWKTTTAMMRTRTRSTVGTWQYMNRFKRRLTDRQDLVVLAGFPVDDPALASIALGWQMSVSTRVTFDLAAGATIADPKQQMIHVAVKWQML
jgi:hypothetical protein